MPRGHPLFCPALAAGANSRLARRIARKSLVLLRNDGILPLGPDRRVAVIGPNAESPRNLFGDYTYPAHVESLAEVLRSGHNVFAMPLDPGHQLGDPDSHATTVAAALRARFGPGVRVAHGCDGNSGELVSLDNAKTDPRILLDFLLQILGELFVALHRHHSECVDLEAADALALLIDAQAQAAADRLPALALGAYLAQGADLKDVGVVPTLLQRGMGEDELELGLEAQQLLP